jgi:hypothetical protein
MFDENEEAKIKPFDLSQLQQFEQLIQTKYTYFEFCSKIMTEF